MKTVDCPHCKGTGKVPKEDVKYGCYVDLFVGDVPDDSCVIDLNRRQDCVYGGKYVKKEDCEYWKPIL
jgi:hypothetical protein